MNIALILAGGIGSRMGADIPKQYIKIDGKSIIAYCLEKFINHEKIDYIQIVADEMWHDFIFDEIKSDKIKGISLPGQNRQLSIYNGLVDIKKYANDDDFVIIHDAVRPCVSQDLISECLETVKECDGVLPVLPMKDTVYISNDGKKIDALIDRKTIVAGQAPETFALGKYYYANERLLPNEILKINGSTEPAIMAGLNVAMIDGDESNFKITTKEDLELFKDIVKKV